MAESKLDAEWKEVQRPPSLTRSFQFESYADLRLFLDELADLSEASDYYPNLNFTRTHVNVSIQSDGDKLASREYRFAEQADALASRNAV